MEQKDRSHGLGREGWQWRSWLISATLVSSCCVACGKAASSAPVGAEQGAQDTSSNEEMNQEGTETGWETKAESQPVQEKRASPQAQPEFVDVPAVEPEFEPGMSVLEATNAVPPSADRLNIEQDRLAEPLMQAELYEPCGLQGHQHFTMKVAVWDGKAVGLDVATKPQDQRLESCLRSQVEGIQWQDRAKSLNTVEFEY